MFDNTANPERDVAQVQSKIDTIITEIRDVIAEPLLDFEPAEIKVETVVAQIIMEFLCDHPCCPTHTIDNNTQGYFSRDLKKSFIDMGAHMGPDYAQALYHAAKFITKVA